MQPHQSYWQPARLKKTLLRATHFVPWPCSQMPRELAFVSGAAVFFATAFVFNTDSFFAKLDERVSLLMPDFFSDVLLHATRKMISTTDNHPKIFLILRVLLFKQLSS
jgi:hypothetical protein